MARKSDEKVPVTTAKEAIDWLRGKLDERPVPKHQAKGPIPFRNPPAYVPCPICTRMFAPRLDRTVGVPKRHQRAHMKAHKLGLVRKVREREADDADAV